MRVDEHCSRSYNMSYNSYFAGNARLLFRNSKRDIQMILVTGATGNNGLEVLKRLAVRDVQVRAMVRNCDRASTSALPSVEIVAGDFDHPETLLNALGVERAFLLTNSSERAEAQLAFVNAAQQSGVNTSSNCRSCSRCQLTCALLALPCGSRSSNPSVRDGIYISAPQPLYAGLLNFPLDDRPKTLRSDR